MIHEHKLCKDAHIFPGHCQLLSCILDLKWNESVVNWQCAALFLFVFCGAGGFALFNRKGKHFQTHLNLIHCQAKTETNQTPFNFL